jgi:Leucine-rich repeat (LRR) protein
VVDISPLSNLTNLSSIWLSDNEVVDLCPLANLVKLRELNLDHNNVVDISPLSNLTNLYSLGLGNNEVVDISPLANLVKLQELNLDHNNVVDISPLLRWVDQQDIIIWIEFDLSNNYLDLSDGSPTLQDVNALISRGVDLVYLQQKFIVKQGVIMGLMLMLLVAVSKVGIAKW